MNSLSTNLDSTMGGSFETENETSEFFIRRWLELKSFAIFIRLGYLTYLKIAGVIILIVIGILLIPQLLQKTAISIMSIATTGGNSVDSDPTHYNEKALTISLASLDKKLASRIPKSYYLVINSASNEFYLYKGTQMVNMGRCSTGSYILLENGENQRWMFKTPKGEFRVKGKTIQPVWKKPDWAFVEEGLPVPSPNHNSRFEYGVLGDYALYLGDGYMIHGTLYQRFIGLPVTHGCVRLNDEDLAMVYKSLNSGSKVFIY